MENMQIILLIISWIGIGIIIGDKWENASVDSFMEKGFYMFVAIIACPIVLFVAIIRQVFIEKWK